MGALTGVMSPLLGKLTGIMGEEYAKLKGARKKLESLTKELIAINVMLEKYAAMERPDVQLKAWIKAVRELAYDMEDRVDLFTYYVDREPAAGKATGFKGFLRRNVRRVKKLRNRYKFAGEIQELQALVDEAYERRLKYKLDESTPSAVHTEIDPRLPALYVEMEKLVGMEGPIDEIVDRFVGENPGKQRRVVSIVGSGGSGKTTLAQQLYTRIKQQFSNTVPSEKEEKKLYTAFVSVSQKPNISNILRTLLSETEKTDGGSEQMGSFNDQQLIDRLRKYLQDRRYLIVIDDIWSKSAWEIIHCALPKNDHSSRIITTTRIKSIAEFCCTSNVDFVYPIKPLSRSYSRELFLKRTFNAEDGCPGQLEGIMNEILHRCDGLPLAIVTLGSLLANKPKLKEEWKRVMNSIRSTDENDEELEVMDKILALSYNDLPLNLKPCLLHLSMFPEDYEIEKFQLIWRWIAEGFVVPKHGYTLEEVGESYYNELINRSLIQPLVHACRVHDIVLDFIVSRSIQENFVSILDGKDIPSPHEKIRRLLCFREENQHAGDMSLQTMDLSHLRSVNLFSSVTWMPTLLDLQVLRVLYLHLEGCHFSGHLENIGRLIHLRYLGIRSTEIVKLPVQIGKLEYLQTLDLRGTKIVELPGTIVHLKRLVRLVGYGLILPDGFGNMDALQELWEIDGHKSSINFGLNMKQLRVLGIRLNSVKTRGSKIRMNSPVSSVCSLGEHSLLSVYIYNDNRSGDIDSFAESLFPAPRGLQKFVLKGKEDWFSRFPKWINPSLSKLMYLKFNIERMHKEDLHMLAELPFLHTLILLVSETPKEGLRISPSGFPCLTHLDFFNVFGAGLRFEQGTVLKLQELILGFDAEKAHSAYGDFGCGIRHLFSLQCIHVKARFDPQYDPVQQDAVVSIITKEIQQLPNHPTTTIQKVLSC